MKSLKKLVGEKIRKRRKEVGFGNQSDLADAIGVDQSRVSRWESGAEYPDPKFRIRLSEALRTTEKALFDLVPGQPPSPELTLTDAAEILSRLGRLSPLKRQFALAWIYQDETFLDEESPEIAQLFQSLSKLP